MAASIQRQALNALGFLYRHVLDKPLVTEIASVRGKRQQRRPTVLVQAKVHRLLAAMTGRHALMAKLLYGGGLRLLGGRVRRGLHSRDPGPEMKTTEIYTHVMTRDIWQLQSPRDRLPG